MTFQIEKGNILSYLLSKGITHVMYKGKRVKVHKDRVGLLQLQPAILYIDIYRSYGTLIMGNSTFDVPVSNINLFSEICDRYIGIAHNILMYRIDNIITFLSGRSCTRRYKSTR